MVELQVGEDVEDLVFPYIQQGDLLVHKKLLVNKANRVVDLPIHLVVLEYQVDIL